MAGQHGIIGDNQMENLLDPDFTPAGIEEKSLAEDKKMARFSKSAEFKRLKGYITLRIAHYQTYLPDGRIAGTGIKDTKIPTPEEWAIANTVIGELAKILSEYEQAAEAVKDANRRQD